jgi:mono/diheme cytochrome c family protein
MTSMLHARRVIAVATFATASLACASEPALGPLDIDTPALMPAEAKALRNPIPYTRNSIERGRELFAYHGCGACHGIEGKAASAPGLDHGTDLAQPGAWKFGTVEGQVFRSIRDGAAVGMPPMKAVIPWEEDVWHLVNFVRSLWPEGQRPVVKQED